MSIYFCSFVCCLAGRKSEMVEQEPLFFSAETVTSTSPFLMLENVHHNTKHQKIVKEMLSHFSYLFFILSRKSQVPIHHLNHQVAFSFVALTQ